MTCSILIIEDHIILAKTIAKYLSQRGFEVRVSGSGQGGLATLKTFLPDVVLLDFNLPGGMNGLEVLEHVLEYDASIKIIMFTGEGNVRLAVDAMKAGAYDYLSKPIVLSELKLLLDRAIGHDRKEKQLSYYNAKQATLGSVEQIVGKSKAIKHVKDQIAQIIAAGHQLTNGTLPVVLINGETGTGKELVARALHFSSRRCNEPFIELNVATIPTHLVESELFGFEKGAFTDAHKRKLGLVEAANGGTLFLDEIGDLDLTIQAKVLKLLEDHVVRRIGGVRSYNIDVQIISATNRSLKDMVTEGTFREDLFFRLNALTLFVPPLRERNQDILLLAQHFVAVFGRKYNKPNLIFGDIAKSAIMDYHWPGNVRQLRNVMEQAVMLCDGPEFLEKHFAIPKNTSVQNSTSHLSLPTSERRVHDSSFFGDPQPASEPILETTLEEMERNLVEHTLREVGGNVSKGARRLGITRDQLRYRIKKYRINHKY